VPRRLVRGRRRSERLLLTRIRSMQPSRQRRCTYIQACIHTCIHTCIRTYIHTYIHTYIIKS